MPMIYGRVSLFFYGGGVVKMFYFERDMFTFANSQRLVIANLVVFAQLRQTLLLSHHSRPGRVSGGSSCHRHCPSLASRETVLLVVYVAKSTANSVQTTEIGTRSFVHAQSPY